MILVAGATGFLGAEICRRLVAAGHPVRGLVRATSDAAAVAALRAIPIDLVEGDLGDGQSLAAACRDVSVVISTVTTTRSRQPADSIEATDRDGQLNLIDAARAAGVERFIYISYSGQIGADDPLTQAKRAVEQRLRASGMTYTILRPSYFMEVWLSPPLGFDYVGAKVTVYGSGENRLSWISLRDVAEIAVRSLSETGAANAVMELGGPEALSPLEVIRIFEETSGRPFAVQHVPQEALEAQQASATDSLSQAFAALMLAYAKGDQVPMDEMLRRYPLRLTSVRDYARQVLSA